MYGAPIFEDKNEVWDSLKRKVMRSEGHVMCIRDFNDVVSEMENGRGRKKERRKIECF